MTITFSDRLAKVLGCHNYVST